jgi:aerobic-type carbon monoxide dehydrogenase small subunit (CoxS/CutS family)
MAGGLEIKVNGRTWPVSSSADTPLLYVLTDEMQLQGPRFGCGLAQCGSCSVLVDGVEIRSCITPVSAVTDKSITTLEGLAAWYAERKGTSPAPALHPLQQAFIDVQAPHLRLLLQRHDR